MHNGFRIIKQWSASSGFFSPLVSCLHAKPTGMTISLTQMTSIGVVSSDIINIRYNTHLIERTSTYITVVLSVFVDLGSFDIGQHTAARAEKMNTNKLIWNNAVLLTLPRNGVVVTMYTRSPPNRRYIFWRQVVTCLPMFSEIRLWKL